MRIPNSIVDQKPAKPLAILALIAGGLMLNACSSDGDLNVESGVGINATRTGCPIVAIPDATGDITIFSPESSRDANAIDVVAAITNLKSSCNSTGEKIYTAADFEVQGRRTDSRGARTVTLRYFSTVVQGGSAVVAKRIGQVVLQFADGQARATAMGKASSYIDGNAARLPADIVARITKKRRAGDTDAALDPLADPEVRAALARASFELLVGFQMTEEQLRYNATR
jgi:hypothetical protein